jgi:hypothetical protein
MVYPSDWTCPIFKTRIKNNDLCTNCTYPRLWHCKKCKKEVHSSMTCQNCGHNPLNPKKSKTIIKKKNIMVGLAIVYLIIIGFIVFFILTQDKISTRGELLKNNPISIEFWTFKKPNNVIINLTSPTNEVYSIQASNNGTNNWIVSNIILTESGYWEVLAIKYYNGETNTYTQNIKINNECTLDEHCSSYGEDYSCNRAVGVCIQSEPDIFDFLDIILG